MISAIVLAPESWTGDDLATQREIIARSMVWLVSAVIAGVVRDVTLAVPAGLGLADLADQSGCRLVQADTEEERLSAAAGTCREPRILVLKAGFQPDSGAVDEIEVFLRQDSMQAVALLLERPATLPQRLFPQRAPVAGVIVPKDLAQAGGRFAKLAARVRRRGTPLSARLRPIR